MCTYFVSFFSVFILFAWGGFSWFFWVPLAGNPGYMPLFLASMVYYLSLLDNVATDKPELIGKMNREKKA
jgi:hypothetical protein